LTGEEGGFVNRGSVTTSAYLYDKVCQMIIRNTSEEKVGEIHQTHVLDGGEFEGSTRSSGGRDR